MADDTLFDRFLSHNSRDLEAARKLAAILRDRPSGRSPSPRP